MPGVPPELQALLQATTAPERDDAWARFVDRFSALLLYTARKVAHEHDQAMDCYAFVLAQLRGDDCRRLRRYTSAPSCAFSTWFVVVARNLCLDEMRSEYGRDRGDGITDAEIRATRKRLVDGIAVQLDHAGPLTDPTPAPDEEAAQHELLAALAYAVDSLEPREQLLLSLRFHDDFSAREIAQLLEMPTPFHAFRAIDKVLAKLRQALGKKGFTDGDD